MENNHNSQLEEIDRQQREKEQAQEAPSNLFAATVAEALTVDKNNPETPLLPQEEIEEDDPPRVNLTAVFCTLIVAISATIILCVAKPWQGSDEPVLAAVDTVMPAPSSQPSPESAAAKPVNATQVAPQPSEPKEVVVKNGDNTIPLDKVTSTGSDNPYNNLRLVNASARLLTQNEIRQLSKPELALARNAIYARHGYQFKNPELSEFFAKQSWFKPSNIKIDSIPFTRIELDNIKLIRAQESQM